jgi:hypothetical protein
MNGAAARTAETPPIIFRKSLRDNPGFFDGLPPSNAVVSALPQQFRKSVHPRQELEYLRPLYANVLLTVRGERYVGCISNTASMFHAERFVRLHKSNPI